LSYDTRSLHDALPISIEQESARLAPDVVREVYDTAARLNHSQVFPKVAGPDVTDDHLPLLMKGIRVIDLIDFDYPPWHTLADTRSEEHTSELQSPYDI